MSSREWFCKIADPKIILRRFCRSINYGNVWNGSIDPSNRESFMDYCMPRADDFCSFALANNPVPAKTNILGIKGAGEAGTTGALPAVMNAVNHALADQNIRHLKMPLTSEKVWKALNPGK